MVAHPSSVIRRGTTLVFRRRVPLVAQKHFFSKTFFSVSLRTHLIPEARRRAAIAARFIDDLIGLIEMCGADMFNERQMDAVVDDLMRFEMAASEVLRETSGPRGPEAVTAAVRLHEATRDTMRAALVYNDYQAISAPLARTLTRLGLEATLCGEDWLRTARRAARGLIEVANENINREQGVYRTDDRLLALASATQRHTDLLPGKTGAMLLPNPPAHCAATGSGLISDLHAAPITAALMPKASDPVGTHAAIGTTTLVDQQAWRTRDFKATDTSSEMINKISSADCEEALMPSNHHDDDDVCKLTAESRFSDWFEHAVARKREESPGWDTNNLSNWRSTRKLFIERRCCTPESCPTSSSSTARRAAPGPHPSSS